MAVVVAARRATPLVLLFLVSASLFPADASAAAAGPGANLSFVLAAEKTHRKDPLDALRYYTGGWNISNEHYWASVGFTAAPVFAAAGVWFVVFGIALFLAGCCFCCCPGGGASDSYSRACLVVSLLLLLVATAAAAVGCAVLYDGQGRFHGTMAATVDYVVRQSGDTVANLRSFTGFLETAKAAGVGPVTLPDDVKGRIDDVVRNVGAAADVLAARTSSNAAKIRAALETVRKVLIVVAAAMLILAFLGLVFSLCGLESVIYVLVFFGWILVAGTFVLCGTFLLLHNVVGDTCVAMGEWVAHPQARTALDDILPCVDTAAATEALDRSKEVNYQLVAVLNGALANVSNRDFPPGTPPPLNYNQSGPPVPRLCNPYTPDLRDRACAPGELTLDAAPQAWRRYVCASTTTDAASGAEVCATPGRVTPSMYDQLAGAANVSYGLYHYGPVLVDLADCTFVRETFGSIGGDHCPGLRRYSGQVFRGLLGAAVAVLLAVLLWVVHARERRRRSEARELLLAPPPYKFPVEERAFLKSPARQYM
ncbi:hypothetical protein SETIT_1G059600v2 [Setaria italica]|uniref:Uncharacterized protein n=1 Tax=Setaria italica TaxID=4555 RepID=K3YYD6_SETIT|nr:uncharacterized protein LOC101778553 [Setaria italica]RCV05150.1 hypothetical protein SETIT_1G059600v2 [Setaria italica]